MMSHFKKSVWLTNPKTLILFTILLLKFGNIDPAFGNNISVTNLTLTGLNISSDFTHIKFDLSWENSWRTSSAPGNWDAAWVFAKYSLDGINWQHAKLHNTGHTSPSGSAVQIGLVDEYSMWDHELNPAVGAFFYRSADGTGYINLTNCELRWDYGANGVPDDAIIDVKVFAIEMVYVPQGSFYAGSGGTEIGAFYKYPNSTAPFLISSEDAINIGTTDEYLYYPSASNSGDQNGPLPGQFPKGFNGFYCMKYEVSQQQYVDFLNTISPAQATYHFADKNLARNTVTFDGSGSYSTSNPFLPNNYMKWADCIYYAAWAGLRPMTELEFEKASRGSLAPVANEFVWGTASVSTTAYTLVHDGLQDELILTNYNTNGTAGNSNHLATNGIIGGPFRSGIFAASTGNSGRVTSGSTYYGIQEMGGNLWERIITLGNPTGRSFTGKHGNGAYELDANWPGINAVGAGFKGGAWSNGSNSSRISDRNAAGFINTNSYNHYGFRAVRTAASVSLD